MHVESRWEPQGNNGTPPLYGGGTNQRRDPAAEPCQAGSLTGAVASQIVTEACQGSLRPVGNRPSSANAKESLTARQTRRAGAKAGVSDPHTPCGRVWA